MLTGRRVLIAEDEPILALDRALSIEEARGEVVGPVATVAEALAMLAAGWVEAAILDVHLADEMWLRWRMCCWRAHASSVTPRRSFRARLSSVSGP